MLQKRWRIYVMIQQWNQMCSGVSTETSAPNSPSRPMRSSSWGGVNNMRNVPFQDVRQSGKQQVSDQLAREHGPQPAHSNRRGGVMRIWKSKSVAWHWAAFRCGMFGTMWQWSLHGPKIQYIHTPLFYWRKHNCGVQFGLSFLWWYAGIELHW